MLSDNPLILAVLSILKNSDEPIGLYELMQELEAQGYVLVENAEQLSYEMQIFRKNFVVMNALYQIQHDIAKSGYYLYISSLKIVICAIDSEEALTLMGVAEDIEADQKLADYYLDWDHYFSTGQTDVEALFDNFWKHFDDYTSRKKSDEGRLDALTTLELESDASWKDVQQSFRKKAAINHPDRGGDSKKFIEIREAYQLLKFLYQKSQKTGRFKKSSR